MKTESPGISIALEILLAERDRSLTLHLLSLADLGGETGLDGGDGPAGSARVASDEVETVLSLVEFGIRRSARFAGNVLDYH